MQCSFSGTPYMYRPIDSILMDYITTCNFFDEAVSVKLMVKYACLMGAKGNS